MKSILDELNNPTFRESVAYSINYEQGGKINYFGFQAPSGLMVAVDSDKLEDRTAFFKFGSTLNDEASGSGRRSRRVRDYFAEIMGDLPDKYQGLTEEDGVSLISSGDGVQVVRKSTPQEKKVLAQKVGTDPEKVVATRHKNGFYYFDQSEVQAQNQSVNNVKEVKISEPVSPLESSKLSSDDLQTDSVTHQGEVVAQDHESNNPCTSELLTCIGGIGGCAACLNAATPLTAITGPIGALAAIGCIILTCGILMLGGCTYLYNCYDSHMNTDLEDHAKNTYRNRNPF